MTKPDIEKGIATAHPTAANDEPVSVSAATTTAAKEEETETSVEPGEDDRDVVDEAVSTIVHSAAAGEGAATTGETSGFPTLRPPSNPSRSGIRPGAYFVVPGGISATNPADLSENPPSSAAQDQNQNGAHDQASNVSSMSDVSRPNFFTADVIPEAVMIDGASSVDARVNSAAVVSICSCLSLTIIIACLVHDETTYFPNELCSPVSFCLS